MSTKICLQDFDLDAVNEIPDSDHLVSAKADLIAKSIKLFNRSCHRVKNSIFIGLVFFKYAILGILLFMLS